MKNGMLFSWAEQYVPDIYRRSVNPTVFLDVITRTYLLFDTNAWVNECTNEQVHERMMNDG